MKKVGLYLISDSLAHGHLGIVYKAEHSGTHQKLAVKVISLLDLQPRQRTEMENEARMLMTVTSPHIVKLVEYVRTPSHCYMFMELCPGGNLEMRVQRKGPVPEDLARKWLRELLLVLVDLRRANLIHRDLKLSHLMLTREEEGLAEVKLSGFGFSKYAPENSINRSGLGTPIYMAPEILRGQAYTYKVDVWSLGVLIYRLLLAQDPYNVTSLDQLRSAQETPIVFSKYCSLSAKARSLIVDLMQFQQNLRPDFERILTHPFFVEEIPEVPVQIRVEEIREKEGKNKINEERKAIPQKGINVLETPPHDPTPVFVPEESKSAPKPQVPETARSPQPKSDKNPSISDSGKQVESVHKEETHEKRSPLVIEEQTPHLVIARVQPQYPEPVSSNVFLSPSSFHSIKPVPGTKNSDQIPALAIEMKQEELSFSIIEIAPLEDEYSIISPTLGEADLQDLATEDVKKILPLAARYRSKAKDSIARSLLLVCDDLLNENREKGARLLRGFSMQESYISTLIEHMLEKQKAVQRALDALGPGTKATPAELLSELKTLMTIATVSLPPQRKEIYTDALLMAKVGIRSDSQGQKASVFYELGEECERQLKELILV